MKIQSVLKSAIFGMSTVQNLIPGFLLCVMILIVATLASNLLNSFFKAVFHLQKSPVSGFMLAMILGIFLNNIVNLPKSFRIGIRFCLTKLLRLGIILMGLQLSLFSLAKIGAASVGIVAACIAFGIGVSVLLARYFRVSDRLAMLIAGGTGICGISAIVAISPIIQAKEEETAYAISTITIFGVLATLLYPYLCQWLLGFSPFQSGVFIGTAVHDTSQVAGAAFIYDQLWHTEISKIAIAVKLVRNTFLMLVIPFCAFSYWRKNTAEKSCQPISIVSLIPVFVFGFIAMALFRSLGDYFILKKSASFLLFSNSMSWHQFVDWVQIAAKNFLAIAVTAAGLGVKISSLKTLSLKPFIIGLAACLTVGTVSYLLITFLLPLLAGKS